MSVYIPASVRGPIYAVFAAFGLLLGAVQIAFTSTNSSQPTWLTAALAVYPFLGAGIGYTAASNTPAALSGTDRGYWDGVSTPKNTDPEAR